MDDETPLLMNLGLRHAFESVKSFSAAFIPQALNQAFCRRVQDQLDTAPFERLPDQIGPVRQEADLVVTRGAMTDLPAVAELRDDFVTRLCQHTDEASGLAAREWWPNEAYVQRYAPGALGVTPHVDSARFAILVAVFTTQGTARFVLCRDRAGDPIADWEAGPGSLVLLRGTTSRRLCDRPFHQVHGPSQGPRFSVTLRMNTATTR
jgi:hypothetical protein